MLPGGKMSQRAISKRAKSAKRKPGKIRAQGVAALPVFRPNTAGIDIGAMEIFVAVSPELDAEPGRRFGTVTRGLEAVNEWPEGLGGTRVAVGITRVALLPRVQL